MNTLAVFAYCMLLAEGSGIAEKPKPEGKEQHQAKGAAPASGPTSAGLVDPSGEWRGARWGMSVDEVLSAYKGEARRVEPELKLADGNVVAVRIDGLQFVGRSVRAAFVFAGGKLALVSLRTLEMEYAPAEAYVSATKLLAEAFGAPGTATSDDNFIDMRQATWVRSKGAVDLKYIPGVLVLIYRPPTTSGESPAIKSP